MDKFSRIDFGSQGLLMLRKSRPEIFVETKDTQSQPRITSSFLKKIVMKFCFIKIHEMYLSAFVK